MNPTVYYNQSHAKHAYSDYHPECPARVEAIVSRLKPYFDNKMLDLKIFSIEVPESVRPTRAWTLEDGDTYCTPYTQYILRVSYRMIKVAVDDLLEKSTHCAFVLTRPPGHHASTKPSGFCHENNVWNAVNMLHARGITHIAIYDWDVHHGDGTQTLLANAAGDKYDNIRFVSTHAYGKGIFPGTGAREKTKRFLSIPMKRHTKDAAFLKTFDSEVVPFLTEHAPQILIVSAGYDAHVEDPMQLMDLTNKTYKTMAQKFASLGIPVLFLLEGGYNPDALSQCVLDTLLEFK